jgi:hypothetical protein
MDYFRDLFTKKHILELILSSLMAVYLVIGFKLPISLSLLVDTLIGKIILILIALMLFAYSNPILGVLALLVVYQMITSAGKNTGSTFLKHFYPTEQKKWSPFTSTQQFSYTLEEEVVQKMTPQKYNTTYEQNPYKPILNDTFNAASL